MAVPGATLPPPGQGPGMINADGTPTAAAYGGGASAAPSTAGALGPVGPQAPAPASPWGAVDPNVARLAGTAPGQIPASSSLISPIPPKTTVPTPPPTGPQFMNAAMLKYVAQFQQSQAQQQQAINSGLITAMSGLGARRDAAAAVSAGLPAQYNTAYQAAQASNAKNDAALAPNLGPANSKAALAYSKANAANNSKAGAAAHAADLGSQAMMNAGITADYSQGQTALSNTQMQNQSALDAQGSNFALQMAHDQATFDQAQQEAAQNHTWSQQDTAQALKNSEALAKFTNPNIGLTPAQAEAAANLTLADQHAVQYHFTDAAALAQATNDPFYQAASKALLGQSATLPNGVGITGSRQQVIQQIAASNWDTINALLANGAISSAELTAAQAASK